MPNTALSLNRTPSHQRERTAACIGYASSITLPQNTGRRAGLSRRPIPKQKQSTCALKQMTDAKVREDLQSLLGVYLHHVRQTQGAPRQAEMTHPHAWFSLLTLVELSVPKHPWEPRGHQKGAGTPDAADETNQSKMRCARSLAKPNSVARWGLASRRRYIHQKTGEHPTATFRKLHGTAPEHAAGGPSELFGARRHLLLLRSCASRVRATRSRLTRSGTSGSASRRCRTPRFQVLSRTRRLFFSSPTPGARKTNAREAQVRSNVTRAKLAAFGWRLGTTVGVKLARPRAAPQQARRKRQGGGGRSRRFQASRPAGPKRRDATRASPKNEGETITQKNSRTPQSRD